MREWVVPGRKVVCVRDFSLVPRILGWEQLPVLHGVYTIRGVLTWHGMEDQLGIKLVELHNRVVPWRCGCCSGEVGFNVEGFRPLDERPTDISQFQRLTRHISGKLREDA